MIKLQKLTEKVAVFLNHPLVKHPFIALLVFTAFWSIFLIRTGTLNSGFHFVDDHEMITINSDLRSSNYFAVTSEWITRDLGLRFRPLYIAHRVFTVQLLGVNFFAYSIQNLLLAIFTSWFLYLCVRKLKFRIITSYLFVFFALVGAQAAIWWRLGPNETIGVFFLSFGLYMLTTIHVNPVKRRRHQVLATIGLVLASLCKESFILMIPAALLLNFYCELPSFKYKWKQTILGSKALNAVLSLVFIVEGLIVVFAVGTNKIGYAGADSGSFNLPKLFETFKNLASDSNSRMLVILGLIYTGVIIISYDLTRKWNTKSLMRVASAVVLFCAIVFPQVFLYTKSGIYERYMIPGVLGFAFLSALFWQEIISMIEHNWLRIVITLGSLAGVALLFYPYYKLAVLNANAFTAEGEATFTSLSEIAKFDEKSTVVIVADPVADFENSYSLNKYLTLMQHKSNIYLEPLLTVGYDSKFKAGLDKGFVDFVGQPTTAKLRSDVHVSAFFVFKDAEEKFLGEDVPFFAANQYTRHEFGDYIVYTK